MSIRTSCTWRSENFAFGYCDANGNRNGPNAGNCSEVGDNIILHHRISDEPLENGKSVDEEDNDGLDNIEDHNEYVQPNLVFPPSFSLGLTQEENAKSLEGAGSIEDINESDDIILAQFCHKSKRQKTIPAILIENYQCDKKFLQRTREFHLMGFRESQRDDYSVKFGKLVEKLKKAL
ncbi:unnamed protein product [Arabis nemorensis]|uniref:Uncharacterized protein n=1 Tax=Arabis nemorensis TaxID=586526 RepID=A0A565BKB1_9BRAS|nr:unnamed protein product [Arabis nemorensis]